MEELAQGIGQALYENAHYDKSGQLSYSFIHGLHNAKS